MSVSVSTIEECLRRTVLESFAKNTDLTLRQARSLAEQELGLQDGFFKQDDEWNEKSRSIVLDTVQSYDSDAGRHEKSSDSRKRSRSDVQHKQRNKRRKSSTNDESNYQSDGPDEIPHVQHKNRMKPEEAETKKEDEDEDEDAEENKVKGREDGGTDAQRNDDATDTGEQRHKDESESEMSSLIDEPAPKRRKQTKGNTQPKSKPETTSKALTSDEEMIKTLQSQLLKCGVRKLWHRELEPFRTQKDKIGHLRGLLKDVGMTGRFSAERARQIKESRELAAELESAQEFEKSWGTEGRQAGRGTRSRGAKTASRRNLVRDDSDEDEDESDAEPTRPPIRAGKATGLVDFGDSGDDGSD